MVTVTISVAQPVWQVGQTPGPVTVTVGVTGHFLLGAGTVTVVDSRRTQSGCGGQVAGMNGQYTVGSQLAPVADAELETYQGLCTGL